MADRESLAGRTIVVTRAAEQASVLTAALGAMGATVLNLAAIRIADDVAQEPIARAMAALGGYDWLVFTSANGVRRFWALLGAAGLSADAFRQARICAIGPATAAAIEEYGAEVALTPSAHVAEGAAEALQGAGIGPGVRVLLPRAAVARPVLPEALRGAGAVVDDVAVYRTIPDDAGAEAVRAAMARRAVWSVTFTSPSTVRGFVKAMGSDLQGALTASIGPITSAALRLEGMPVDLEASPHTVPALLEAMVRRSRLQAQ